MRNRLTTIQVHSSIIIRNNGLLEPRSSAPRKFFGRWHARSSALSDRIFGDSQIWKVVGLGWVLGGWGEVAQRGSPPDPYPIPAPFMSSSASGDGNLGSSSPLRGRRLHPLPDEVPEQVLDLVACLHRQYKLGEDTSSRILTFTLS